MAVATAAIVCVLSVFNGFRGLLSDTLDLLSPDILVTPAQGKVFADSDSISEAVKEVEGINMVMPEVSDNALALYNQREMPVTLRGVVPDQYAGLTHIDSLFIEDNIQFNDFSESDAAISIGVLQQLGIATENPGLFLFAPRREGRVNLANPMSSFLTDSVTVGGIFQAMQAEYDENTVICDIAVARELFQYTTEATSLLISVSKGANLTEVAKNLQEKLGSHAIVKDRYRQQDIHFRMVSIEKWMTFLLLIFILLIASFNIISTLCMLIIEKQQSMTTLSSLGRTTGKIGKTFWWESIYVCLAGGIAGILLGVCLCLIQEKFGIIKLGGDPDLMVVPAYPVVVEWMDIIIAFAPVVIIGLITAWISSAFARSRV